MNTITTWDGKRQEFQNFNDFVNTKNKMRKNGAHFTSYHDNKGDTHLCEFIVIRGGVACLGLWGDLEGKAIHDCTGKHFSHYVYSAAAEIVKYEMCENFQGWSL